MSNQYSGIVRARDPEPSWEAADRQTPSRKHAVESTILTLFLRYGAMTDEQLVERYAAARFLDGDIPAATPQNVRTRRHTMRIAGRILDTGRRAKTTATGNTATVWDLTTKEKTSAGLQPAEVR